jgi:membrane-associated protease RseP (regulator of RpoE activity)
VDPRSSTSRRSSENGASGQDAPGQDAPEHDLPAQRPSGNGAPRGGPPSPDTVFHPKKAPQEARDRYWLHALLFLLTLASCVWTGGWQWTGRYLYYAEAGFAAQVLDGLRYAVPLLLFLTVHEFGHYFAARRHGVSTSLPYYIPFPFNGVGTFGAVIRIREPLPTTRKLFDVGAAGPLAGFVVALGTLLYALATLPPPEYLLDLPGHEALKAHINQHGAFPETMPEAGSGAVTIVVGQTPLFWALSQLFPNVPPMYEIMHYPVLFASWFGLLFTALNLLPVGQLDGGHVLYALFGKRWHGRLAHIFVLVLLASASIGFAESGPGLTAWLVSWVSPETAARSGLMSNLSWFLLAGILYYFLSRVFDGDQRFVAPALLGGVGLSVAARLVGEPLAQFGYTGWFFFCLLIVWLIKVEHPPVVHDQQLTPRRRALGWLAIAIFVLCFSLRPLHVVS